MSRYYQINFLSKKLKEVKLCGVDAVTAIAWKVKSRRTKDVTHRLTFQRSLLLSHKPVTVLLWCVQIRGGDCAATNRSWRLLYEAQTRIFFLAVFALKLQNSSCEYFKLFWFLAFSCSSSYIYDSGKASSLCAGVWKEVFLNSLRVSTAVPPPAFA